MIVVTGSAGFIGSAFVWKLNEQGHKDILLVDEFELGDKWKNVVKRQFTNIIHKNDFLHMLSTDESTASAVTAVVHMGACSSTTERDVDYLIKNNIHYSMELFKFCADRNIPYIYASSAATYGNGENGDEDNMDSIEQLRPINAYGWSKQVMDEWALKQKKTPSYWAGLKFFNVYGPNEYHKGSMMSLVCKAVPQIKDQGFLKLFKSYKDGIGHGEQKRDFVYVKDVVDVMYYLLDASLKGDKKVSSGIFNLGCGEARSFADLGRATFSAMDIESKFEWIEMPEAIRGQYQYFTEASLENLRSKTGYDGKFHSLEEGVTDYVQNYLLKEDPYL
jgi:ADP-L-glycero-D-manno-heptose 6-epimerase